MIIEPERILLGYSKNDHETIIASYARPSVDRLLFPQN